MKHPEHQHVIDEASKLEAPKHRAKSNRKRFALEVTTSYVYEIMGKKTFVQTQRYATERDRDNAYVALHNSEWRGSRDNKLLSVTTCRKIDE